jgi:hypothetical protein
MPAGDGRYDGDLADPDPSEPMPQDDRLRAEPPAGLPLELGELRERRGPVDLVPERLHAPPRTRVRTDPAGEDDDPSGGRGAQRALDLREAERSAREAHHHG